MSSLSLLDDVGKYTRQLYKIFAAYFEILKPVIIENFAKDVVRIEGKLEELQDLISTNDIAPDINKKIECIEDLHYQRLLAEDIFNNFERPDLQSFNISNSNLTGTSHLAIVDAYEEMNHDYTKIIQKMSDSINDLSEEVAEALAAKINQSDDKVAEFEAIHQKTRNILLFDLYIFILAKIQNTEDERLRSRIRSQLEKDKTNILCNEEFKSNSTSVTDFIPLRRFGLKPISSSMPIKDLFSFLELPRKSPSAVAKETKFSILVINSVVYKPVEYDFSKIFKSDEKLSKEYGITNEFIARMKLINYKSECKYNFSYEYHDGGKPIGYVIETIDGENYRALSYGTRDPFDLENIVSYYKEPHKPTRVSCYQEHCINAALPNMMVEKTINSAFYEITSKSIDAFYIQNQIILRLNGLMHTMLAEKKISSNRDVIDMIHSSRFVDEFSSNLLDLYKIGAISNIHEFSGGQFSFAEILSTFIVKAEDLKRQFSKEMHDGYTRGKMINFADQEQVKELPKVMEQLIASVVHLVLPNDENIYSVLNYKYMLMNHTEIV